MPLLTKKILLQSQDAFEDRTWTSAGVHTLPLPVGVYNIYGRGGGGASGDGVVWEKAYRGSAAGAGGYGQQFIDSFIVTEPTTITVGIGEGGKSFANGGNGGKGGTQSRVYPNLNPEVSSPGGAGGGGGHVSWYYVPKGAQTIAWVAWRSPTGVIIYTSGTKRETANGIEADPGYPGATVVVRRFSPSEVSTATVVEPLKILEYQGIQYTRHYMADMIGEGIPGHTVIFNYGFGGGGGGGAGGAGSWGRYSTGAGGGGGGGFFNPTVFDSSYRLGEDNISGQDGAAGAVNSEHGNPAGLPGLQGNFNSAGADGALSSGRGGQGYRGAGGEGASGAGASGGSGGGGKNNDDSGGSRAGGGGGGGAPGSYSAHGGQGGAGFADKYNEWGDPSTDGSNHSTEPDETTMPITGEQSTTNPGCGGRGSEAEGQDGLDGYIILLKVA